MNILTELSFPYQGMKPQAVCLERNDARSILPDSPLQHVLIQGENLDVLSSLGEEVLAKGVESDTLSLREKVDVVYLDPPYNTGNGSAQGFVYNDNFRSTGDRHAQWLSFMKDRLELIPALMKDTGVIFVSIDDSEVHRLRMLMDSIFGERNFMAQLVVDGGAQKNNARFFSISHEYMLVYAKNLTALQKSGVKFRKEREGIDVLLREYKKQKSEKGSDYEAISAHLKTWVKTAPLSARLKVFYRADSRGLYTYADLSTPGNGPRYEVIHPVTGKPCKVPSRGWGVSQEKMAELIKDDMIIFGKDETHQPLKKHYLRNIKDQVQKGVMEYSARYSTHALEKILGRRSSFNNPKNLDMMANIIDLTCPDDGIVLDAFAGSGTTGHAVVNLNQKKGTSRRFVMVTNNENDIFEEVTYPRMEKVLQGANKKAAKSGTVSGMAVYCAKELSTDEPEG